MSSNVGCTHLSIALSNYLSGKFFSNTAYLEMNGSHEIQTISRKRDPSLPFTQHKITYYPNLTISSADKILSKHYTYFVLDFGCPNSHTFSLFMKCDIQIIIGYTQTWKHGAYEKFVKEHTFINHKNKEACFYIGNTLGSKNGLEQLSHKIGKKIIPMPSLENPFQITSDQFSFFEEILGGK